MEENNTVRELLFEYHMIYQQELKREVSQKEFAEHIGLDDKTYNHIYKGRRKVSLKMAKYLAQQFDDPRFYEAAGMPTVDPDLFYVQNNWESLANEDRKQVSQIVAKYVAKSRKK